MGKLIAMSCTFKATTLFLTLAIAITCASSARILDENPSKVGPAAAPDDGAHPVEPPVAVASAPVVPTQPTVGGPTSATTAAATSTGDHQPLTFFMHDILGGSHPSARVVTGIVASSAVNGEIPFARNDNGRVLPINGGVPLLNGNINGAINGNVNGVINGNSAPFLTGLGGQGQTVINGNNVNGGNGGLPFVAAGQLPVGSTLEKLMFGTITVIDDEITEGHEVGSTVMGKAQGFYVASSQDGTSQTIAFTAMFESDHYVDSLSFLGVHRTASDESQVAVVGGTGKYANAKGYAAIQTLHPSDQHTTDGVETLLQFTVYVSEQ